LADSNPDKTLSTPLSRPSWDQEDTFIGFDQPTNVPVAKTQLSLGAPVSISQYIDNPGDGTHWLERLTLSAKIFQVPVQVTRIQTGTADNTDAAGEIDIVDGTSGTYRFVSTFQYPPHCNITPMSDPGGVFWETITTDALAVNLKSPGSVSFSYQCWARY